MISRRLRIAIVVAVTALSSGIPQVALAALDDDCCTSPCDGFDGKRCPPNCPSGVCAKVHVSLGAVVAPSVGPRLITSRSIVIAEPTPQLPPVVTGVFHPPIA